MQQQVAPFTVVELNYVGNIGRFLNGTTNINIPEPATGGVQARRPFPTYGNISYFDDSLETTYHSLQASVEQRTHDGLFYLVSYTWSKSLSTQNVPPSAATPGARRRSPASTCRTTWRSAPATSCRSAATGEYLSGGARPGRRHPGRLAGPGHLRVAQRPAVHADDLERSRQHRRRRPASQPPRVRRGRQPDGGVWFDKTAFALPAQFTYGDSGGGILREDSYKTLDFSLFKQFRMGTHRLQFRAEVFNLTNTPSFNAPNTTIDTAAGGRVTSTASARVRCSSR